MVGREEVPARLRHLLNVESGVNDGLALPFLLAAVAWSGHGRLHPGAVVAELGGGVALGACVPWLAVRLERTSFLGASREYRRVGVLAVGMLEARPPRGAHARAPTGVRSPWDRPSGAVRGRRRTT